MESNHAVVVWEDERIESGSCAYLGKVVSRSTQPIIFPVQYVCFRIHLLKYHTIQNGSGRVVAQPFGHTSNCEDKGSLYGEAGLGQHLVFIWWGL